MRQEVPIPARTATAAAACGAFLARLVGDVRGTAVLEFAFVAGPFFALLIAILETSLIFFTQEALETSVETSSRKIFTGEAQASDDAGAAAGMTAPQLQARFKQQVCATLPTYMSCNNLLVDVQSTTSWSQINTQTPVVTFDANGKPNNPTSYSLGGRSQIVLVRLMYVWPLPGAPGGLNMSNLSNGGRLIQATSVAKTENYS